MKNKSILINIIVAIVVGAGAFYGGMQYQKAQSPQFAFGTGNREFRQFNGGQARQGQTGGTGMMMQGSTAGGAAMRPVAGEIIDSDETSITVKSQDGSSKIVLFSDKTTINKQETGTSSDLKKGETIAAFGKENSDGSVTAESIQLNPMFRVFNRPTGEPEK